MADDETQDTSLILPGADKIRKVWHQEQWFYSVVDIIAFLTESENPGRYWSDLKRRVSSEGFEEVYAQCVRLKMPAPDGKQRLTDAADRETIFRIVQSVPSPKAEPLKLWLAEAGEQRLQTLERTQVDIEAERRKYRLKGYPEEWIEKRIQSILARNELTQEWDERGAEKKDYGLLTDTIARGTFGISTQEHKQVKALKKENLRDHMTPMELVLTMLGEVTTTELHRERDSLGTPELRRDAKDGGDVAGRARKDIEQQLGAPVVSPDNYLDNTRQKQHTLKNQPAQPVAEADQENNS